ncbi:MAG: hypothetical protein N2689_05430, partial [Verrucomicrobiae bacterium]|nr:hypothetical protein [Verrucomicrobiae bacterium]
LGALFGGGTTCSALYHGENGLSEADVLDMATRDPAGRLVDAWNTPGCRHGTLSNPRYLDYILRWCRSQMDAGADYLFMDEHNAALERREGYDDYSLRDFRDYLLRAYCAGLGWSRTDARWREKLGVDPADRELCSDGTLASFDYRVFLRRRGLAEQPRSIRNPFLADWQKFRAERDERAWKKLTDSIRDYARSKGRRVLISANGLAKFVDLQVLGVWGLWRVKDDRVDLAESQMHEWHAVVRCGRAVAERKVPVVFFHDWGFMGFPWLKVPPSDRELWMRVRGAEIYAAGGFFAFPVTGPFGCDALKDGTLGTMARLTQFYSAHKEIFLRAQPLAMDCIESNAPQLSTALWTRAQPPAVILHVINRATDGGRLRRRETITLDVPTTVMPERVTVLSPDEEPARAKLRRSGGKVRVDLTGLEAHSVIMLDYRKMPKLSVKGAARIVPGLGWERPTQNEYIVHTGGVVNDGWNLQSYFQGRLHAHLRNPPTFIVNAPQGGKLLVRVRAVARAGARLEFRVDDKLAQTADLPDRDGRNDGEAQEYAEIISFAIPPGQHRLGLDNTGGDWARLDWLEFQGVFKEPALPKR